MKLKYLPFLFTLAHSASATVFVIGDGFALDGSGSFGVDPTDDPFSSPGNENRDNSITNAETSSLFNLTTGSFDESPFSSSEPIVAGQISFGSGDIFQGGTSFDLSLLPSTQQVSSIELFLEVTNSAFNNGVNETGDVVNVGVFAGAGAATFGSVAGLTPDATFSLDNANDIGGTFISISLDPDLLDLSVDNIFSVILDAGEDPDTAAVFGSGLGPGNNGLLTGTDSVSVSPALRITVVPEPSSAFLAILAGFGLALRRRR